jgi:hypothetical protein
LQILEQWRRVISMCGEQRNNKEGREVVVLEHRHVIRENKSKNSGEEARKDRMAQGSRVPGQGRVSAPIKAACLGLFGPVKDPSKESCEDGFL